MKQCKNCLFWKKTGDWEGECGQPDFIATGIELTDAQYSCEGWKSRHDKADAAARFD